MAKFKLNSLPEKERIKLIGEFYDVMSLIKQRSEARQFLKDLLNPDEIAMLVRRIQIATLLLTGFTYDEIIRLLKVGKSTIGSVYKKIERGGEGYELIIKSLLKLRKKRELEIIRNRKRQNSLSDFEILKKKYPFHFLIFNLADALKDYFEDKKELKEINKKVNRKNILK